MSRTPFVIIYKIWCHNNLVNFSSLFKDFLFVHIAHDYNTFKE